jgi:poly-beta-1,6-N-acetyl-D-glucosamine N-deacetylase
MSSLTLLLRVWGLLLLLIGLPLQTAHAAGVEFQVICYHDVRDDPRDEPDRYTVSTSQLVQHFSWLKESGYNVVGIDDILAARRGGKPLPPKAVLLTFDDAYKSFRTKVFPLLKAFGYPGVLALVGKWLEVPSGERVPYDSHAYSREDFLSWEELREMMASGLVEVASHSYDLHKGIPANPQGNTLPAAITRQYSPSGYEPEEAYRARILDDLTRNSDLLEKQLGKRPRIMVWPYGRYNETALELARQAGMPLTLTLDDDGINTDKVGLDRIKRILVSYNPTAAELAADLSSSKRSSPVRVMHVDLDYVHDPDPVQQEVNLSRLLDRVKEMGISTVYLQAYADPDGNGVADALYFPNRHLPMRADLFSRVAWQLQSRAGVKVFAWMPLLAFELPSGHPDRGRTVGTMQPGKAGYHRLTPFDPRARQVITEIYEDLARHAIFQGILFHDDATFSDYEDASPAALRHYAEQWQLPADVSAIRADPELMRRWTQLKTRYLTAFTLELSRRVARDQPQLKTGRNLYAKVALEPDSEAWFAQSLPDFLSSYDFTAIMAMPFMEEAPEPLPWLGRLIQSVAAHPGGLEKSVFELQSVDWRQGNRPVPADLLAKQMRLLQTSRAINFGYYPDNFFDDQPPMSVIRPLFSLQSFPYR